MRTLKRIAFPLVLLLAAAAYRADGYEGGRTLHKARKHTEAAAKFERATRQSSNEPGGAWYRNGGLASPWVQSSAAPPGPAPTPSPAFRPGATPPPQAAAVGYTVRTYGPNVTLGKNWWGLAGANLTQNKDGSVTDHGGVPNHWNAHCTTAIGSTGDSSGDLKGCAFGGGGYFEATFSWTNPPSGGYQGVDGWPAIWATSIESADGNFNRILQLPNKQNLEYDAYEAMTPSDNTEYNAGIIAWYGGAGAKFSNNDTNQSGATHAPPGTDVTRPHRVGWLWVPATPNTRGYIKNFYDGQQVGNTYTWAAYAGGSVPGKPGEPGFSITDIQHFRLWFGSGTRNPITVYSVEVWQRDASKNLGASLPSPAPQPSQHRRRSLLRYAPASPLPRS